MSENVEGEINDLLSAELPAVESSGGEPPVPEPPPSAEGAPPAETPSAAVEGEPPPQVEGVTPPEGTPSPSEEPPTPTPPAVELTKEQMLEKEVELLRSELVKFTDKAMGVAPPVQQQAKPGEMHPSGKPVVQPARPQTPQMLNFIKDEAMFDETMKSAENMNALLTVVVKTAVESIQRSIPSMVSNMVNNQVTLRTAASEFYKEHSDPIPHKSFVGFIANEITAQHPDWGLEKVLQETSTEARKRLMLKGVAGSKVAELNRSIQNAPQGVPSPRQVPGPAFVPGGGGRRGPNVPVQQDALSKEIADLIEGM